MLETAILGDGAARFIESHRQAKVVGVFTGGFYLGAERDLMAVVGPSISPGPLNLVVRSAVPPPADGASCTIRDVAETGALRAAIEIGRLRIAIGTPERFSPTLPEAVASAQLLRSIAVPIPADLQSVWPEVLSAVTRGDVAAARDRLCGRGRGLTPEGDDVLAGLVMVLAADQTRRPKLTALIADAQTTDLSRAFLAWAAVGQCVAEIHDLLVAADAGDREGFEDAERRVRGIGGSTGPAMLAGISLAMTFPIVQT